MVDVLRFYPAALTVPSRRRSMTWNERTSVPVCRWPRHFLLALLSVSAGPLLLKRKRHGTGPVEAVIEKTMRIVSVPDFVPFSLPF